MRGSSRIFFPVPFKKQIPRRKSGYEDPFSFAADLRLVDGPRGAGRRGRGLVDPSGRGSDAGPEHPDPHAHDDRAANVRADASPLRSWSVGQGKALVEILEPAKEEGIASLRVGDQMWNFLPKTDQTVRVPTSLMLPSWMGSDFTNGESDERELPRSRLRPQDRAS